MPVSLNGFLSAAQADLQGVLNTITQVRTAVANGQPATPGAPSGLVQQAEQAAANLQKAAGLQNMLPVAIFAGGVLLGKPAIGAGLAILVYLAGKPAATPAPAA